MISLEEISSLYEKYSAGTIAVIKEATGNNVTFDKNEKKSALTDQVHTTMYIHVDSSRQYDPSDDSDAQANGGSDDILPSEAGGTNDDITTSRLKEGLHPPPVEGMANGIISTSTTDEVCQILTEIDAFRSNANCRGLEKSPSNECEVSLAMLLGIFMGHVRALLPASFSSEASEIDKTLKRSGSLSELRVIDDEIDAKSRNDIPDKSSSYGDGMKALVLDPSYLDGNRGSDSFFKLADKLIGLVRSCGKGGNAGNEGDSFDNCFLSGKSKILINSSARSWPNWMLIFSDGPDKRNPIPLAVILLAGFELSIEASYERWLQKNSDEHAVNSKDPMLQTEIEPAVIPSSSPTEPKALTGRFSSKSDICLLHNDILCDYESTMREEIARILLISRNLSSHYEQIHPLICTNELREIEKLCHGFDRASLKFEYLLAPPFIWFTSSPGAVELDHTWNKMVTNIFPKMRAKFDDVSSSDITRNGKGTDTNEISTNPETAVSEINSTEQGVCKTSSINENKSHPARSNSQKKSKKKKKKKVRFSHLSKALFNSLRCLMQFNCHL